MKWVKASELKEINWPVCIKYDGGGAPHYETVYSMEELNSRVTLMNTIEDIFYLDESSEAEVAQKENETNKNKEIS